MASAPYERLELNNNSPERASKLHRGSAVVTKYTAPKITKTEANSYDELSSTTTSLFKKGHSRAQSSTSTGITVRFRKKKTMKKPTEVRPKSLMVLNNMSMGGKGCMNPDNAMSLIEALNDKRLKAGFRMFLDSEFSVENLDFWLAVEEFKKIKNPEARRERMKKIYEEYVSPGALNQINLDHFTRQRVIQHMANDGVPSFDTFTAAQRYVFNIMENDSYARFVRSKCYEICNSPGRRSPKQFFYDILHSSKSSERSPSPNRKSSGENVSVNDNNNSSTKLFHKSDSDISESYQSKSQSSGSKNNTFEDKKKRTKSDPNITESTRALRSLFSKLRSK